MERVISATEANQHFSELLRNVAEGETFTVVSRGKPVARMSPIDRRKDQRSVEHLLEFVKRLPHRSAGNWSRDDLYE